MAYVITESSIGTKDTTCVDVCPWTVFTPGRTKPTLRRPTCSIFIIHPDECIVCGACVPACPVDAIFALDETPQKWNAFIPKNADYYNRD